MTKRDNLPPPDDKTGQLSNPRHYGIDLLRMLSMYMVCMHHVLLHGGILSGTATEPIKHNIALFFNMLAYCAVNCFALISGYVGVKSRFKYRNLFRLWLQAVVYTLGISLIFYFAKPGSVGLKGLVKACFPICTGAYWYLTAYTLMFFAIPQMNFILEKQPKITVRVFLLSFFIIFSMCSLPPIIYGISSIVSCGYSAIWLTYLYFVGGFIRTYGCHELFVFSVNNTCRNRIFTWIMAIFNTQWRCLALYFLCILLTFLIYTEGSYIASLIFKREISCYRITHYNSPLTFFASLAFLVLFSRMRLVKWSTFIQYTSPLAFGVYLIHDNDLMRYHLIRGAFTDCGTLPSFILPIAIIGIPLAIYVICSVIDYVRLRVFRLLGIV